MKTKQQPKKKKKGKNSEIQILLQTNEVVLQFTKKNPMLLAGVILSKLIIKACHRTKNATHQRKFEVAMTEGKTVLL